MMSARDHASMCQLQSATWRVGYVKFTLTVPQQWGGELLTRSKALTSGRMTHVLCRFAAPHINLTCRPFNSNQNYLLIPSTMNLPEDLRIMVEASDISRLETRLTGPPVVGQEELDECLSAAMPAATISCIRTLLIHGAKPKAWSLGEAMAREDVAIFQLLVDHGWDINSAKYGRPAIQSVTA